MKQLIETDDDIDIIPTLKKLIPATVLALSIVASSTVMAANINNDMNNQIVAAMYGFQTTQTIEASSYTDADYETDLVRSIYGQKSGPDYSKESVYINSLINSVEGKSHPDAPDFSDDEVYVNYLIEVTMK